MKQIYLDNAATTPIHAEVIETMHREFEQNYGNPSSLHQFGRAAKAKLEQTRKSIASHFNRAASTVIFTGGGTEADNLILRNAVTTLGVKRILSSPIEHHAVLHSIDSLVDEFAVELIMLPLNKLGGIDLDALTERLKEGPKTLVSLMHINNEIGNILPLKAVSDLCKTYEAYFHSDTVQTIGHYGLDLKEVPVDFITASAHKFHGPKGVGFALIQPGIPVKPLIRGGAQERGTRAGTENIPAIVGMGHALDLAVQHMDIEHQRISGIKQYFIDGLVALDASIQFNGQSNDLEASTYTVLNVRFPRAIPMMLFQLDLKGVAASGGSACQSGSDKGSHVLATILNEEDQQKTSVRFSFGYFTTKDDIDKTLEVLRTILF